MTAFYPMYSYSNYALPNGTEPLIFLDFKNGVYTSSGVTVALAALLTQNADWGVWNPATMITAGVGLSGTVADFAAPVFTGAAFDLVAAGATILLDYSGADVSATSALRYEMVDDLNNYNLDYINRLSFDAAATNFISDQFTNQIEATLTVGAHKTALTMIDGKISRSTDGAAIITINPAVAWVPAPTVMGFILDNTITLRSVGLYPAQPDADLPTLSAL